MFKNRLVSDNISLLPCNRVFVYSKEVIDLSASWEIMHGRDPSTYKKEPGFFLRYDAPNLVKRWAR